MTFIPGYAYTAVEKEEAERRYNRYKELGGGKIKVESSRSQYGQRAFSGFIVDKSVSEEDILIFCDRGNTCFGGNVTLNGDHFTATVYTD